MNANIFLTLEDKPLLQQLGPDYYDEVKAAQFPKLTLRFRNDNLLPVLGLDPTQITDQNFLEAFGQFKGQRKFLALRYHGHQFGEYNSQLGDGRGFLYGQFIGHDGSLYDLGTKGSGTTPYSRGGDGRLTLKGGVREALAGEALYALGISTSRCLSLVETGEALWRGDEPSPARSSVMVRLSRSHIRFGTFERLLFVKRPDLIRKLLDHIVDTYYRDLKRAGSTHPTETYVQFYDALVQRTAAMAAGWMSVGFCHGVLNTDNMSITGESFDYGPYAFIRNYDPQFTAAYFDPWGYYRFGNQPEICRLNLERLQDPLETAIPRSDLEAGLAQYGNYYQQAYTQRMLGRLGLPADQILEADASELLNATLQFLSGSQISYHSFFARLTRLFSPKWREQPELIFKNAFMLRTANEQERLKQWTGLYQKALQALNPTSLDRVAKTLRQHNPPTVLLKPEIEAVWDPIVNEDDWLPFYELIKRLQAFQWESN